MRGFPLVLAIMLMPVAASAQGGHHGHHPPASPYAGEERRAIKSLSEADLAELRRGGGWGLAKAAELNGYPGPAHLLELKEAVGLAPGQVAAVQALFERMQAAAKEEGARFIALETALEEAFRDRTVTPESLRAALGAIAASQARLRGIHLAAHLDTVTLISPEQVAAYNRLRGYAAGACAAVPAGHDAAMWRRHNGCD